MRGNITEKSGKFKSSTRYEATFNALKKKGEGAFIPFVVLGDPNYETSKSILEKMAEHADCLELGFPFSDPIADGTRIQAADERSLKAGISTEKCFSLIRHIRKKNNGIPIGLLLYYNLVFSKGSEKFIKEAASAGVDGLLIADMPIEEAAEVNKLCRKYDMKQIFIVSPTTKGERLEKVLSKAKGFVYIVGVLGVTGERTRVNSAEEIVKRVKKKSKVPACVGFGISNQDQVREVINYGAEGAISGSAVEAIIEKNVSNKEKMLNELEKFFSEMKSATKTGK